MLKSWIQRKLEAYVRKYFVAHPEVKLVIVAGSVGKTSTRIGIAEVLSQQFSVRTSLNNHNTLFSVPIAILGVSYPRSIRNPLAWLYTFHAAKKSIRSKSAPDVIVQELGTDHPGEIPHFATYLHPDLAVITAVTPEHMEFFDNLENVAAEELAAANFSRAVLINRNDVDGSHFAKYLKNPNVDTYGDESPAEYYLENFDFDLQKGYKCTFIMKDSSRINATIHLLGDHSLRFALAAAAVGHIFHLPPEKIKHGLEKIRSVPGRMNILEGIGDTIIIDDSYNSSPAAAREAIRTLYSLDSPSRIAILGSMKELGESSQKEHECLARLLDPGLISHLVTVGEEANRYIAPIAKRSGIPTRSFSQATDVVEYLSTILEQNAVLLFKASAALRLERAIVPLLKNASDANNLPHLD
jgi:UDP-N-acetylmuramoyl-tripeptide--D-alanyl-D-alanine ligase